MAAMDVPPLLLITVKGTDDNCEWLKKTCGESTPYKNNDQFVFAHYPRIVAKKDTYPGVETSFQTWEKVCEGGFELGTKPVPDAHDDIIDWLLARGYSVPLPTVSDSDSDCESESRGSAVTEEDAAQVEPVQNDVVTTPPFNPSIETSLSQSWEENLVLCHYAEEGIQRFRIGHAAAPRPLHGAIFTVAGNEYVSINELTLPLDRFLSMKECWSSNTFARFVCDHVKEDSTVYEIHGLTGQQIREAFIFVHEYASKADRDDDATFCAIVAMLATLFAVLLTLGYFLRNAPN